MLEVTRYVTGKRASHTYLITDSPVPQEGRSLTWRVLEDSSSIDLEEIHNLARFGLKVEELYRGVGLLFVDRYMPELKPRLIDQVTSYTGRWVSPKYQAIVEIGCARMRAQLDNWTPLK